MAPLQLVHEIRKRHDEATATTASLILDVVKRQNEDNSDGTGGLSVVAIALLVVLFVLLGFGVVAIIIHSRKKDATMI